MTITQAGGNMMNADDMQVIAYHEAGHAVVAWSLGVLLKEVRIEPNGGICKHAIVVSPMLDPELMTKADWAKAEKKAAILLAGEVAEQVGSLMAQHDGNGEIAELCRYAHMATSESVAPGSDREELREFVQLIFGNLGSEANDWIDRATVKATNIVTENWQKICSLSDALVAKNVLSGTEATWTIEMAE
jgi:ATP-dependent Zn protease